jgi:surfeit locus 1 family protein
MLLLKFFSRRWWFASLLVIAATLVMARLGIWQLDRLEQRRAFNAQVAAARAQTLLDLNQGVPGGIHGMEWRAVQMTGEYDFANQVAVRNQYYGNAYGYHLLTPLLSQGTAVLVDRGWIPADGRKYDEPGIVTVTGQVRLGQAKPALGGVADALPADGKPLAVWNNADVEKIVPQMPYPMLTVYIQPAADPADTAAPIPYQPEIELTEGPHFGYALQWFTFATILLAGYPFFIRKQESTLG